LHSGIALLAKRSGAPVVPAIVTGTFEAWPRERKFPRRHPVRVVYGQPLRYERGESYDSFCGRLAEALRDLALSAGAEHLIAEESGSVAGEEPAVTRFDEP
jgi:1-acyl-sn-glycerol-3-phosphate acyltransferase